jgi:hypothetical protein
LQLTLEANLCNPIALYEDGRVLNRRATIAVDQGAALDENRILLLPLRADRDDGT